MTRLLASLLLCVTLHAAPLDFTPFALGGLTCTPLRALPASIAPQVGCVPPDDLVLVDRLSGRGDLFIGVPGRWWLCNWRGVIGWIREDAPSWDGVPS